MHAGTHQFQLRNRWAQALLIVLSSAAAAAELKIGVASGAITPFLDQPLAGYYYPRSADGVHDHLQAKALVIDDGGRQVVLVACDTIGVRRDVIEEVRARVQKQLGIPADHVLISATHCHTGPQLTAEYAKSLGRWIGDTILTAHGRKQPARLFVATEQEPSLPHCRRYWMKDGTVQTNPGFLNPNVVRPVGSPDPRVGVLFAESEAGQALMTWVNYGMHLDTVGGTWISADYPYFLARLLSKTRGPDMTTVFTIGAAGNINHWDVRRPGPQRGLETAHRLGEVLGAAVTKAYTHLEPVSPPTVRAASTTLTLPVRKITPQEVEEAKKILATPPPPNVDFTLDRVKASRVMAIHRMQGKELIAPLQAIAIGPVAIVAIPGELFTELGLDIQKKSPFPYTFIVTLANDSVGYIPTRAAYEQGSYEPTSTRLAPGAGELMVEKALELLSRLQAKSGETRNRDSNPVQSGLVLSHGRAGW